MIYRRRVFILTFTGICVSLLAVMENSRNNSGAAFSGLLYGLAVLFTLLLAVLFSFISSAFGIEKDSYLFFTLNYLVSPIALFTIILCVKRYTGTPLKTLLRVNKPPILFLGLAVLLPFSVLFGFGTLNGYVQELGKILGLNVPNNSIPLNGVFDYLFFTFLICLLPAAIEEAFFRGVLLKFLDKSGEIVSAFTVGLCFALFHFSLFFFVYQFIFGVILGILSLRSKSIFPGFIAHFLNNFINLSILYFNFSIDFYSPIIISAGVLVTVFCLVIAFREKTKPNYKESVRGFYIPFGIVGMAAAIITAILGAIV